MRTSLRSLLLATATVALAAGSASAADAEAKPEAKPIAGYKGGFFLQTEDGSSKLKINGRVQLRLTMDIPEQGDTAHHFAIQRARVALSGNVLSQDLTYKFQMDLGKGGVALKDFQVGYKVVENHFHITAGQFKKPFSRQQLTSSGKQVFADRAITDKAFGAGRDIGILLSNNFSKSPTVEWAFGVYNGTGDKANFSGDVAVDPDTGEGEVTSGKFSNVPSTFRPQLAARVGYNFGKLKGYSEGDFEGGGFRFGVGSSLLASFDADGGTSGHVAWELDAIMKVARFDLSGAFYLSTAQGDNGWDDQDLDELGFHLQASYVIAEHFVPALRYERVMPAEGSDYTQVWAGGFGLYLFGHAAKLDLDAQWIDEEDGGDRAREIVMRAQVQLAF